MLNDYIKTVYLASQSLGRKGILEGQGLQVLVYPTDTDESGYWTDPSKMVHDLALRKLTAFIESGNYKDKNIIAIASDTVVVLNNKVIGKAKDEQEAKGQLTSLSGREHYVYSSYAVCKDGKIYSGFDRATVHFNNIEDLIDKYIQIGEWKGAAGSYRIQNLGQQFIKEIEGDINTVIGLPLKKIENIIKPKEILVHCCCGPCATSSIQALIDDGYTPVLHYQNSNIDTKEENDLRFDNLKKVAEAFNINLYRSDYNHQAWLDYIKGLESEPEHGKRCVRCFEYNLRAAKEKAKELGIDFFTTTLTVSRFKNSKTIFEVGKQFEGFLEKDFKKNDGFAKSVKMAKEMGLYRQQYCGCEFSKEGSNG